MRIALADDDESLREYLRGLFLRHGHQCHASRNGRDLLTAIQRDTFDLLVVDWNMPGMEGIEVVRWARERLSPCPAVLMLTSRADKDDIAQALNCGADDYIVKPEAEQVIMARVNALARRAAPAQPAAREERFGDYLFDHALSIVRLREEEIALTSREFALARMFFANVHRPLSRAYLLETLWHSVADLPTRTLDMHISRVRSKLRLGPENGYRLQTLFGYGYRLERFGGEESDEHG